MHRIPATAFEIRELLKVVMQSGVFPGVVVAHGRHHLDLRVLPGLSLFVKFTPVAAWPAGEDKVSIHQQQIGFLRRNTGNQGLPALGIGGGMVARIGRAQVAIGNQRERILIGFSRKKLFVFGLRLVVGLGFVFLLGNQERSSQGKYQKHVPKGLRFLHTLICSPYTLLNPSDRASYSVGW